MALKLIANYSKRLGLPGYSSHQFSVCVETEITNIEDVAGESSRLYQTLQQSVDSQIQQTGFVPGETYAKPRPEPVRNGSNGSTRENGNGHNNTNGQWQCSEKQRDLIEKIVRENNLDRNEVDQLAIDLFGEGVKSLNRLAASGLIDELLERYGKQRPHSKPFTRGNGKAVRS